MYYKNGVVWINQPTLVMRKLDLWKDNPANPHGFSIGNFVSTQPVDNIYLESSIGRNSGSAITNQ